MKIVEWITSFFAWLQILASPLLIGLIIGFVIYKKYPTKTGLILSICIVLLSLLIGIIIATRIWKKKGTTNFISKIAASPDLDDVDDAQKHNHQ